MTVLGVILVVLGLGMLHPGLGVTALGLLCLIWGLPPSEPPDDFRDGDGI